MRNERIFSSLPALHRRACAVLQLGFSVGFRRLSSYVGSLALWSMLLLVAGAGFGQTRPTDAASPGLKSPQQADHVSDVNPAWRPQPNATERCTTWAVRTQERILLPRNTPGISILSLTGEGGWAYGSAHGSG